jgi:hypothetical protein
MDVCCKCRVYRLRIRQGKSFDDPLDVILLFENSSRWINYTKAQQQFPNLSNSHTNDSSPPFSIFY